MALPPLPPGIPGVSGGDRGPSPLQALARRLNQRPETAHQKIARAVTLLQEAAREYPRMADRIGDLIRGLVQAEPEDEDLAKGTGESHGNFSGKITT